MKEASALKERLKAKTGFTLVELIVVFVVIGILMALVVSSSANYAGQAKDREVLADARRLYIATQTVATEAYAKGDESMKNLTSTTFTREAKASPMATIASLGKAKNDYEVTLSTKEYQITEFVFESEGKVIEYDNQQKDWSEVRDK